MELRHLRYFVAVAEERSFVRASRRLRLAQPSLSRQIQALETEVGATLFHRLPRGVALTSAGEAFLEHARTAIESAGHAVAHARVAAQDGGSDLTFAHGELSVFSHLIETLLSEFRGKHPQARIRVSSQSDADAYRALREKRIDVACVFIADWPVVDGLETHRIVDCATTGVLLPATHPLAAQKSIRLAELSGTTWIHSGPQRWPGTFERLELALRDRGLVPQVRRERPRETPAANIQIAAGEAWALATEAVAAPYRGRSSGVVYRPFVEPPIPFWIALVWLPEASHAVHRLVQVARDLALAVPERKVVKERRAG
jgi:DNA-binding transcriptional LysR family regulator